MHSIEKAKKKKTPQRIFFKKQVKRTSKHQSMIYDPSTQKQCHSFQITYLFHP